MTQDKDQKHEYIRLLITIVFGIFGFWLVSHLDSNKQKADKLRELKTSYLIETYKKLAYSSNPDSADVDKSRKNLEEGVADIQLFGSLPQIELIKRSLDTAGARFAATHKVSIPLDSTLNDIRNSLREELELPKVTDNVKWIRVR